MFYETLLFNLDIDMANKKQKKGDQYIYIDRHKFELLFFIYLACQECIESTCR